MLGLCVREIGRLEREIWRWGLVDLVWVAVDGFGSSPIVGCGGCFLGPFWFGSIQSDSFLLLKFQNIFIS